MKKNFFAVLFAVFITCAFAFFANYGAPISANNFSHSALNAGEGAALSRNYFAKSALNAETDFGINAGANAECNNVFNKFGQACADVNAREYSENNNALRRVGKSDFGANARTYAECNNAFSKFRQTGADVNAREYSGNNNALRRVGKADFGANAKTYSECNNVFSKFGQTGADVRYAAEYKNSGKIGKFYGGLKKFFEKFKEPKQKDDAQSARDIIYSDDVYLGGIPIGISLTADGLIIAGKNDIITKTGVVSPSAKSNIMNGDVLLFINDKKIAKPDDIAAALNGNKGEEVLLKLRRGKMDFFERIKPAEDSLTGARRLGLIVKTDLMGVGTLTFVKNNARYGALGHQIADAETGIKDLNGGDIYECSIIGIVKGEKNKAGELRGLINKSGGSYGTIDKNNHFGIFGSANDVMTQKLEKISVGSKYAVKPGKASIRTTIAGETPNEYEIEIVKTNFQSGKSEKGMIIRVTDENLLKTTGGILQGMSGSPIIQDGKLVGAVTHVFVNDPSKGYGMYIDFMLSE
ncbi:MAG: SpoIVB peptidase [Clostridiales bacterium]|jgi:stage IV sporulation protein B|nr:SpoIVB peptidase [Clostridiales bacterium]